MDTFTLVVFLMLIMITVQVEQWPIAGVLLLILLIALKSLALMLLVLGAIIGGVFIHQSMGVELQMIMIMIVVLIIAAVLFTSKKEGPGSYSPGAFAVI